MLLFIIFIIVLPFGVAAIIGAPYLPVLKRDSDGLFELADLKPGQTIIDLGSGDGRFLRTAARLGYRGIGYEINPFLYLISLMVTWRYRKLVTIHLADFWQTRLPEADAIYIFLIERLMPKLNTKLEHEITRSTPVISFVFAIPDRPAEVTTRKRFPLRYGA